MVQWLEEDYVITNAMILDHHNLFIYIDTRYPMFYHDINIIWHSTIYWKCCQIFTNDDEYFEYLLKDLKYLGEKMFIMYKTWRWKITIRCDGMVLFKLTTLKCICGLESMWNWELVDFKRNENA